MAIILCNPGEEARVIDLVPTVETLEHAVGGPVSAMRLAPGIIAWVHDEGILIGLPWNRQLGPETYVAGPIVVSGETHGHDRGLTADEVVDVLRLLNIIAPRMEGAASVEDLERRVGHKAVRFYAGDLGAMEEKCTDCGALLPPERNGFCPVCHPGRLA